ncbi:site-specific integrase [Methylobacterium sp. E-016]|uniref:site-specific integrase n=1 Tax=Methylobacterium sp. E-016 TaxID=2836556 RepID=UPI001FB9806A|nr:site-specific integrase [Methylobacterium sp. E-016]MCJ2077609.1 site-specific integrase [Methylobacterium sp. E-016]
MLGDILTRDNPLLSRANRPISTKLGLSEINFTCPDDGEKRGQLSPFDPGDERVAALIEKSISDNTRRAYRFDLSHFEIWGGTIPSTPATVATYLADHVHELSVATLVRRVATLSKAHEARGLANPCRSEIVRATLRGIKRSKGTVQKQARALEREDLMLVLDQLGESVRDVRDRALLLLGFAGGFRRSELVGLNHADVEHVRHGLIVTLNFSKTDQEGAGRQLGIPHGRTRHCPVAALDAWLALSGIATGPIFRPVDRHGHIGVDRLSGEAVSLVVRERVGAAGINPVGFSGHSLRAGFATSAVRAGVPTHRIRAQTGHASDAMLARYVREGELFLGNAAGALL